MNIRVAALLLSLLPAACALAAEGNPADKLEAPPGFKIEHLLKADPAVNGSWISMAKDPQGRLLLGGQANQPVTRVLIQDGVVEKKEVLDLGVTETMGMLFVNN